LPGLHNVYNVLAASAAAFALGVEAEPFEKAMARVGAAFGRMERFKVGQKEALLALVKNPSGVHQVLNTILSQEDGKAGLLLALNDNIPDGRDVSWIWDVDMERLKGKISWIVVGGLRAYDLALRLKYAHLLQDQSNPVVLHVAKDLHRALDLALEQTPPGGRFYIVPTYTAMWELREELVRRGHLPPFWEV